MKFRYVWLALVLPLCLLACDGDDPEDAGVDAGADAGPTDAGPADAGPPDAGPPDAGEMDAGPPDAGPEDAGPVDAGPPTPAAVATEVTMARTALDVAVSEVPMEMRVDGAFSDLDVAAAGLDALIGEDALGTLALSDATVRALADLNAANLIIDTLQLAIDGLEGRSALTALRTQTIALRDRTTDYRDALARLYRIRLDDGIVGSPVVEESLISNFTVAANGTSTRLLMAVEGASAVDENASVNIECFPSEGAVNFVIDVRLAETGASIATSSGSNSVTFAVPAAFDELTAVELSFSAPTPSGMGFLETCNLSLTSRRRLRRAAVDVPTGDSGWGPAFESYMMAVNGAELEIFALESAADPSLDATVLASAMGTMMLYRNLVAGLVASDLLPLPVEHYQRIARQIVYARAMVDGMLASLPIAPALYSVLRMYIADGMTAAEGLIATTTSL